MRCVLQESHFRAGKSHFRVAGIALSCKLHEMKATKVEIAKEALCGESAVRGAIQRGKLDTGDLGSVIGWVLMMRYKELGVLGADGLVGGMMADPVENLKARGAVKAASELEYEPDDSQKETVYKNGLYT